MTDAVQRSRHPLVTVLTRIPVTLGLIAALLVTGIVWGGLWSPFRENPLFETVAYGLPALLRPAAE